MNNQEQKELQGRVAAGGEGKFVAPTGRSSNDLLKDLRQIVDSKVAPNICLLIF